MANVNKATLSGGNERGSKVNDTCSREALFYVMVEEINICHIQTGIRNESKEGSFLALFVICIDGE